MQVLSPKREEAKELGVQVEKSEASLVQHEAEVAEGEAGGRSSRPSTSNLSCSARRSLVTTTLLRCSSSSIGFRAGQRYLQGNRAGRIRRISGSGARSVEHGRRSCVGDGGRSFRSAARSVYWPCGTRGDAYQVAFDGDFFDVANFIKGLDSMVKTDDGEGVMVDGRLVTITVSRSRPIRTKAFPPCRPPSRWRPTDAAQRKSDRWRVPDEPVNDYGDPAATTTGGTP
jgi:hypothetical protein